MRAVEGDARGAGETYKLTFFGLNIILQYFLAKYCVNLKFLKKSLSVQHFNATQEKNT